MSVRARWIMDMAHQSGFGLAVDFAEMALIWSTASMDTLPADTAAQLRRAWIDAAEGAALAACWQQQAYQRADAATEQANS